MRRLGVALFLLALEQRDDRHGVTMPKAKLLLEISDNNAGFDLGAQFPLR